MANVVGHFVYEKLSKNIHLKISHSYQHGMPVRFLSQFSYTSNFSLLPPFIVLKLSLSVIMKKKTGSLETRLE